MSIELPYTPKGWTRTRIDRVASVNARIGWKALTATEYQAQGYTFLSTPNIKAADIDFSNVNYISKFRYDESPELQLKPGDVLLAKDGNTLGTVNIVSSLPHPATVNGSIAVIRPTGVHPPYLHYALASQTTQDVINMLKGGMGVPHLFQWDINRIPLLLPPPEEQRRIADFLDHEVGKITSFASKMYRLLHLLNEKIDSRILGLVGGSKLNKQQCGTPVTSIRKLLVKNRRPPVTSKDMITAYRDGQVTARSLRRAEGYTLSATEEAQGQYAEQGDVVIHGLDGFAGAIGTSEASGNCSPVYHVCTLRSGGDSLFYGRLLRVLAVSDYLGLFATSTRERAVDFRNWDLFGRIPIPEVSLTEQKEIAGWISTAQKLRVTVDRSTALAEERRRALITAAVTGQIDRSTANGREIRD